MITSVTLPAAIDTIMRTASTDIAALRGGGEASQQQTPGSAA